jgi:hypothetical protein
MPFISQRLGFLIAPAARGLAIARYKDMNNGYYTLLGLPSQGLGPETPISLQPDIRRAHGGRKEAAMLWKKIRSERTLRLFAAVCIAAKTGPASAVRQSLPIPGLESKSGGTFHISLSSNVLDERKSQGLRLASPTAGQFVKTLSPWSFAYWIAYAFVVRMAGWHP